MEAFHSHSGVIKAEVHLENAEKDGATYWSKTLSSQQYDLSFNDSESLPPIELDAMEVYGLSPVISEELGIQRGGRGSLQFRISLDAELEAESISHDVALNLDSKGLIPPIDDDLVVQNKIVSQNAEQIMQPRSFNDYLECPYFRTHGILIVVLIIFALITYSSERKDEYIRYDSWVSKAVVPKTKEPDAYFAT